jgi:signal transduction histidine kinase
VLSDLTDTNAVGAHEGATIRLLLVEDDPGDALLIRMALKKVTGSTFVVEHVDRLAAARERLAASSFDVVFLDLTLPDSFGLDTFAAARMAAPHLPFVIVSGLDDETVAIRAVHLGAQDYLVKGAPADVLVRSIRYAIERRRLLAQVEQASSAKSEFLTRLAHELRTPLNSVLGFAELLRMELPSGDHTRKLDHIVTAGRHLETLIREALDIARIEAGKVGLRPEALRAIDLVHEAVTMVGPLAQARQIRIDLHEGPSWDGWVYADRTRVLQILLNLLSNAIKYNDEAGLIDITVEKDLARARLSIRDTGPGIKPEDQARIFFPFERLGAERTRVEGSGIGLTVAQGLARLMGGELGVTSSGGRGSTFWLELGLSDPPR